VTRQQQKEATKARLVEVATRVFAKEGIAGSSTATIAKAAEVSHGTVFVHFPTRDDLLIAVIDAFGARIAERFETVFTTDMTLQEALRAHVEVLREVEGFYARLVTEIVSLPAKVQSNFFILHAAVSYRLWTAAQRDIAAGRMKKLTRPEMFNTWIALVHYHLTHRALFASGPSLLKEKGEELVSLFLKLTFKEKSK